MSGARISLAGVSFYYETDGEGAPVLLLHPGLAGKEVLAQLVAALAGHYRVVVPERRGHGRTPDTPGPFSYEASAADTIAFIEALDLAPVRLVGLSDGAVIATLVALRRPDLVGRLVLNGKYLDQSGARPEALALFSAWTVDTVPPIAKSLYAAASPDGAAHFGVIVDKIKDLQRRGPSISLERLRGLDIPTLFLTSDDDVMTIEHAAAVFAALPRGQWAVIPVTSPLALLEKPALFAAIVLDFLGGAGPAGLMPLTRRPANTSN